MMHTIALRLLLILFFVILLADCTFIRSARLSSIVGEVFELPTVRWPDMPEAEKPKIKVIKGKAPKDMGVVNGWHVLREGKPGMMELITLAKKPLPFWDQSKRMTLTTTMKVDGSEMKTEISGNLKLVIVQSTTAEAKKGTVVMLNTLYGGTRGLQQAMDMSSGKMVADGWDVVSTSIDPHQFTYRAETKETTTHEAAEELARRIDATIAWEADAVATVLSLLEKEQVKGAISPKRPVIYFGISAGALVVPALAVRHGPPDAAVLVCGGASVSELIFTTQMPGARTGIKLANGRESDPRELQQLALLTRQTSRLDPDKLAPYLRSKPVLLLTAGQDLIVPARLQRELDVALGYPERWHSLGGHVITVFRLPDHWSRLDRWMQAAVQSATEP